MDSRSRHAAAAALGALLVASAAICGGCSRRSYDVAPVSGTVTLDGKPLEGAAVIFQPLAETGQTSPGPGSTGLCDAQGHYSMTTVQGEAGAVVGHHQVMIRTHVFREAPVGDVDTTHTTERVPPWYNDQTQLDITVPPEGKDDADFALSSRRPRR